MTDTDKLLAEIGARIAKAHREICDLASGKRKWEMCIPPQATDSDMTLQAPLDDFEKLKAMVECARGHLKNLPDDFNYQAESELDRIARGEG